MNDGLTTSAPELLTAKQLSKDTGISVAHLYAAAKAKAIPSYKLGRAVRFKKDEVLAAMKQNAERANGTEG